MQKQYWRFYWPLSLTWLAMVLGRQFQNGALARYPDAVEELATYALASSTFMLFGATLAFVPQMANVLARSPRAAKICFRFVLLICAFVTMPLAALALTDTGKQIIGEVFNIEGNILSSVVHYLRYLLPLIFINGLRQFYTGLLIQAKRTGYVTLLNVLHLVTIIGVLAMGLLLGWTAVKTLALAQVWAGLLQVAVSVALYYRFFEFPATQEHHDLTYRQAMAFFWPVAITSTMFGLSRPILYSFVGRMPNSSVMIAALRVAFDFGMLFQGTMNQFRHLFVTFGHSDLAGLRRFMIRVLAGVMFLMLLVVATPLSGFVFHDLLGVEGEVLAMAQQVVWVLCLVPIVISVRNYLHGLRLIGRKTRAMAVAAICRNLSIYVLAWAMWSTGWLNHWAAGGILVMGFVTEAAVMAWSELKSPALAGIDGAERSQG